MMFTRKLWSYVKLNKESQCFSLRRHSCCVYSALLALASIIPLSFHVFPFPHSPSLPPLPIIPIPISSPLLPLSLFLSLPVLSPRLPSLLRPPQGQTCYQGSERKRHYVDYKWARYDLSSDSAGRRLKHSRRPEGERGRRTVRRSVGVWSAWMKSQQIPPKYRRKKQDSIHVYFVVKSV